MALSLQVTVGQSARVMCLEPPRADPMAPGSVPTTCPQDAVSLASQILRSPGYSRVLFTLWTVALSGDVFAEAEAPES